MANQFNLDITASNGTSNLSYLLNEESRILISTLTPSMFEKSFGPGDDLCFDQSKGYTDPEWYWQASNGFVWGIGWRWGAARLRGCAMGPFHPTREEAAEFIDYLSKQLSLDVS